MSVVDYFLKIDGIDGESQDSKHKGELEVLSFSRHAQSPRDEATGLASGKRYWDDARFTMRIDQAGPQLLHAGLTNRSIKKATLTCRKAGGADSKSSQPGQEYFKITFENAQVSRWRVKGSPDANPLPMIEFSLRYAKITEEYRGQTEKGTLGGAICFADEIGTSR